MLSVGISSLGHTKLIFIDPVVKVNGSYYRLTTRSGAFCKSECIVTRLVTLTVWKIDWFMNCATLISLSLTEQTSSSNSISYLYLWKRWTLWTSDLNTVIVRLRTSCYWVVVQSYGYAILFTVWFLSNAKTNLPETLHYCLQYISVCVHKIMFDSVNFIACY